MTAPVVDGRDLATVGVTWLVHVLNDPMLACHGDRFAGNRRKARQLAAMRNLNQLPAARDRVVQVMAALDAGDL